MPVWTIVLGIEQFGDKRPPARTGWALGLAVGLDMAVTACRNYVRESPGITALFKWGDMVRFELAGLFADLATVAIPLKYGLAGALPFSTRYVAVEFTHIIPLTLRNTRNTIHLCHTKTRNDNGEQTERRKTGIATGMGYRRKSGCPCA